MGIVMCYDSKRTPFEIDFDAMGYEDSDELQLQEGVMRSASTLVEESDSLELRPNRVISSPNLSGKPEKRNTVNHRQATAHGNLQQEVYSRKHVINRGQQSVHSNASPHSRFVSSKWKPYEHHGLRSDSRQIRSMPELHLRKRDKPRYTGRHKNYDAHAYDLYSTKSEEFGQLGAHANSSHNPHLSLKQRMHEHRRNDQFIMGEREANLYADTVEEDTLSHVDSTLRIVGLISERTEDICEEIARQSETISKTNNDIQNTEQKMIQTNYTLNGMKSIGGKITNMLWNTEPEVIVHHHDFKAEERNHPRKCKSKPASTEIERSISPMDNKQDQIKGGIKQITLAIDKINLQTLDIAEELRRQDNQLKKLTSGIDRTGGKIKTQTNLISSMRKG